MRIAVVGYGRMGRSIARVASERGHEIVAVVDPVIDPAADRDDLPRAETRLHGAVTGEAFADVDTVLDFSSPRSAVDNISVYATAGVAAVIGTTGWYDRLDEVGKLWARSSRGLVYGANFSIGAHVFLKTAAYAASLVSEIGDYDLLIHEIHHGRKKDSPSGTALTLARRVMEAAPRKTKIETGAMDREMRGEELHVSSTRGGSFPGTHTLYLDSEADTVEIRHQARSRNGFVIGAVMAAEWVVSRSGIYPVEELMTDLLENRGKR
jgi:4-hydroxy-tetrahydrodipicolinate reductase